MSPANGAQERARLNRALDGLQADLIDMLAEDDADDNASSPLLAQAHSPSAASRYASSAPRASVHAMSGHPPAGFVCPAPELSLGPPVVGFSPARHVSSSHGTPSGLAPVAAAAHARLPAVVPNITSAVTSTVTADEMILQSAELAHTAELQQMSQVGSLRAIRAEALPRPRRPLHYHLPHPPAPPGRRPPSG